MDEYNFIRDSKKELEAFYAPYFDSKDELENFIFDAFDYANGSLPRRQALFQVQRFVSLRLILTDIISICPKQEI